MPISGSQFPVLIKRLRTRSWSLVSEFSLLVSGSPVTDYFLLITAR